MEQFISNYKGNRYKDTHQEVTTQKRLYTNISETTNKGNKFEAKPQNK